MTISPDNKLALAITLVLAVGAGVAVVYPTEAVGWITIAFGLWGLALLGVHHFWERFTTLAAALAFVGFVLTSVLIGSTVKPRASSTTPVPVAQKPDPKAFCFAGFRASHKNKEIGLIALVQNNNKGAVQFTYMGGDFTLNGFPPALQVEAKHETLYPEQHLVKLESHPVKLGRDFPAGTEFVGTFDFQARYGPSATDTALIRVHGKLLVKLTSDSRRIGVGQDLAPDSLPECPEELVDIYANQQM